MKSKRYHQGADRPYLTTREVAQILGTTTDHIRREIEARVLEAERIPRPAAPGRRKGYAAIRVYPEPLRRYIARCYPQLEVGRETPETSNS